MSVIPWSSSFCGISQSDNDQFLNPFCNSSITPSSPKNGVFYELYNRVVSKTPGNPEIEKQTIACCAEYKGALLNVKTTFK